MTQIEKYLKLYKTLFIIILLFYISISCNKKYEYKVIVSNSSDYKIDTLELGCSFLDSNISVLPKSSTWIITFVNKKRFGRFFNGEVVCVGVKNYSDSNKRYTNFTGILIPLSKFSLNGISKLNIISRKGINDSLCSFSYKVDR